MKMSKKNLFWAIIISLSALSYALKLTGGSGKQTQWYDNGQKKMEAEFVNGQQHGKTIEWYENGKMREDTEWAEGKPHGKSTSWHENGQKKSEGQFLNGEAHGKAERGGVRVRNGQRAAVRGHTPLPDLSPSPGYS